MLTTINYISSEFKFDFKILQLNGWITTASHHQGLAHAHACKNLWCPNDNDKFCLIHAINFKIYAKNS